MNSGRHMRRIATEEAFSIPEVADALRVLCNGPGQGIDMMLVRKIYGGVAGYQNRFLAPLLDIEGERLRDMDANGVAMQLLSLTSPGVQLFDADTATELAQVANDRLAEVIARHPTRFAGLAAFAPHSPKRAVREMERAVRSLKLNGFIVNSHTNDEYLDDPKYWPILEAAEALDRCIYIHPRGPSTMLSGPMRDYGMFAALWAYGVEVATHAVRLILSGVLDRYPKLTFCLGHMGEAVHFWLWRIDFMSERAQGTEAPRLKLKPSEYFRRNFVITTSGQESPLALDFSIRQLGIDNVLWAIDYPYQPSAPAVSFMDGVEITDAQRHKLYHQNAERVFHIPP
jgi:5-carboxyvanillate decarboxylase